MSKTIRTGNCEQSFEWTGSFRYLNRAGVVSKDGFTNWNGLEGDYREMPLPVQRLAQLAMTSYIEKKRVPESFYKNQRTH
jgi:hypothetical protein